MNAEKQFMKAIHFDQPGGPDVLKIIDVPKPSAAPGEVLIRVMAAGVNRLDCFQRQGNYPVPPGASPILGLEVAGIIEETGERVCALLGGGGYAGYAVAARALCLPIPDHVRFEEAAALPEGLFTVWDNIFNLGGFQKGQSVLIHGGGSGIGTTAIQMVKAMGGTVIVTAGSDEKCKSCMDLGADLAINYKTGDFVAQVLEFTKSGVNIVLDMVGGDYVARNIECLAPHGRHVSIAFLQGAKVEISLPAIMRKSAILTGSFLRPRPLPEKIAIAEDIRRHVWPLVEDGTIKPLIFKEFPLKNAAEAHKIMENSQHTGKIVLQIG
jgi:putative PIG3 family NAD(P)H quinone oxidoreductase